MERRITGRPLCRNQYKSWFGSGPQSLYQYSDVSRVRRCSGLQTAGPFEILYGCLTKVFNVPDSPAAWLYRSDSPSAGERQRCGRAAFEVRQLTPARVCVAVTGDVDALNLVDGSRCGAGQVVGFGLSTSVTSEIWVAGGPGKDCDLRLVAMPPGYSWARRHPHRGGPRLVAGLVSWVDRVVRNRGCPTAKSVHRRGRARPRAGGLPRLPVASFPHPGHVLRPHARRC